MPQYSTNAIYEYLKAQHNLQYNYLYIKDKNWVLIYGDEAAIPKLFLIVSGLTGPLNQALTAFEQNALRLLTRQPIPVRILRFNERTFANEAAISSDENNDTINIINTHALYDSLFKPYGLAPGRDIAAKPVNDATSGSYHNWQRSFLSGKLKITDVDLIVYNDDHTIVRVCELKRSYIALDRWHPYPDDYANFKLLRRSFSPEIPVYIIYNIFEGDPRRENLSYLRVFQVADDVPSIQPIYREINGGKEFNYTMNLLFT